MLGKSLVVYTREGAAVESRDAEAQPCLNDVDPEASGSPPASSLQTVDAIASVQLPDGNIPWIPGGHTDPWNLVEAAMALDVGGRHDEARARVRVAARACSAPTARWHAYYLGDEVEDPTLDTNVTCYVANGVWHHYLATGDTAFLERALARRRARDRLRARLPARDRRDRVARRRPRRRRAAHRLVEHPPQLRCAIAIAERLGHERPDWELSLGSLAIAIAHRPDVFLDKDRWAMDWYYPILGGVLRGYAADSARRGAVGRRSSSTGRGVRCVSDRRGSPRPRRASS